MAADASAISSAVAGGERPAGRTPSPWRRTRRPGRGRRRRAPCRRRTSSRCRGSGFHAVSICAIVTDSTSSVAVGAEDRVRGVDGHAHARELVLVHLVAAALGQRLAQPDHLDAGLQRVVAGDQADVAAADDEEPLGRPHQVAVDERLEGAGAVDAGQGVALEDERLLARAGGHQQHLRLDEHVAAVAQDADLAGRRRRPAPCCSARRGRSRTARTSRSSRVAMSMPRVPA